MGRKSWIETDLDGLAQAMGNRGKEFLVFELASNGWDENSTTVDIEFLPTAQRGLYSLKVTDDNPDGFADITHAYTMFAPSKKKTDPTKRGRWNFGEKFVLAFCEEASIVSTTASVIFDSNGRRQGRKRTESGTVFSATIRMNRPEYDAALARVKRLIPPAHIRTTLNGELLVPRVPIHTFEATVRTVIGDDDGILRESRRKTTIEVFDPIEGEPAEIFEMGIPVVATGDRWDYNVQQKVPLNTERTNVTDAYKQDLRTLVLNEMYSRITKDDANNEWVRNALDDEKISDEAVDKVMTARFGTKRVIFDSSDPEANKIAMQQGYSIVYSKSLSKGAWTNVKRAGAILPAGKVTPSPKPFHPGGRPLETIPQAQWTKAMWRFQSFAHHLAIETLGHGLNSFTIADDAKWFASPGKLVQATFGPDRDLIVNWHVIGRKIADLMERDLTPANYKLLVPVVSMLIHEYTHYTVSDHFSAEMLDTACDTGALAVVAALSWPDLFTKPTDRD